MSLTPVLTPTFPTTSLLVSKEPKERDIVQRKEQWIEIFEQTLADMISRDCIERIKKYLFVDITKIYQDAGLSFTYIPKSIPQSSGVLSAEQREKRVRTDRDDVLSRYQREFEFAQLEMEQETSKPCTYYSGANYLPTESVRIGDYNVGICSFAGRRNSNPLGKNSNEDRCIAEELTLIIKEQTYEIPLIGVLDGHGGQEVAEYGKTHLKTILLKTLVEFNQDGLHEVGIWNALKLVCVRLTEEWSRSDGVRQKVGTTVLFIIELNGWLYVANLGDSRAVLNNNGEFIQLTEDAKPEKPRFKKSIKNRGAEVTPHSHGWFLPLYYRVNARLACARAAGDLFLDKAMSGRSKLTMLPASYLQPGSDIIAVCDGVVDVLGSNGILKLGEQYRNLPVDVLSRDIGISAYGAGSEDNLSVIVMRREKKENKMREV